MSSSSTGNDAGGGGTSSSAPDRSLYAVLNLRPDATDEEIKRSYRQLATTYHPDKAQDESLAADATTAFHRIQEAYEILSDPARRDIYDVYGLDGVRSGLELTVPGKTPQEMKKEWEAAREQRHRAEIDAAVNFRGQYVFRVDATALVSPYDRSLPRTPEFKSVSMTSGVDIPIESTKHWGPLSSEADTLHLGGFVSVRGDAGGGCFIAGYKRIYSDYTTLEFHGMAGLRTLLSVQTSTQLSPLSGATMVASWQPNRGLGLQVVTTRQLGESTNGELSWIVGPREEAGMALAVTHRPDEKTQLTAKVEVGAATGITVRGARRINEDTTARGGVKLGTQGVEVDIGASKRLSELSIAGLSVVTGLGKGVLLKVRYSRAGHLFEFPIQLSAVLSPTVVIAAHVLPPLVMYLSSSWVVGPLGRSVERRKAEAERRKRWSEIEEATRQASAAAKLMEPVARRKMNKEASAGGLVIALALYGEEEAVKRTAMERLKSAAATAEAAAAAAKLELSSIVSGTAEGTGTISGTAEGTTEGTAGSISSESGAGPPSSATAPATAPSTAPLPSSSEDTASLPATAAIPDAVIDVTTGLQYQCESSRVVLHQGYSKSGLMGFCDPAPTSQKLLLIYFVFHGRPFVAKIADTEGAQLPARGQAVTDPGEAELVRALALLQSTQVPAE